MNTIDAIPTRTLIAEIRRRHSLGIHDVPEAEVKAVKNHSNTADAIVSISQMVGCVFGVTTGALLGDSRGRSLSEVRFAAWLILHDRGFTTGEIARVYRRMDTGTVRHGCFRGRELIQTDKNFARKLKLALDLVKEVQPQLRAAQVAEDDGH